jgi:hypothetical protein
MKKYYDIIRYDIPNFFRNLWYFRKPLYKFRWFDYTFTLYMLKYCLADMANNLESKGNEVYETRMKKIGKIKRAVELLEIIGDSGYVDIAENKLGLKVNTDIYFEKIEETDLFEMKDGSSEEERENNKKIFDLSHKLEEEYWEELWNILKGDQEYDKLQDWDKEYNGSNMKNWWD